MEDILASIKRVIADDARAGQGAGRQRGRASEQPPQPPEEDILELNDPVSEENGLISQDAAAASRQSLATLAAMRQAGESGASVSDAPLEAVVREMLKPMLKEWLDQNLPEIVEELVTREIARITAKSL